MAEVEVARRARMSTICLSRASNLALSFEFEFECGPCVEMHANADSARPRIKCRVSVGTLAVFAFSVLGSAMLNTRSRRSWIMWVREECAVSVGLTSCSVGSGGV